VQQQQVQQQQVQQQQVQQQQVQQQQKVPNLPPVAHLQQQQQLQQVAQLAALQGLLLTLNGQTQHGQLPVQVANAMLFQSMQGGNSQINSSSDQKQQMFRMSTNQMSNPQATDTSSLGKHSATPLNVGGAGGRSSVPNVPHVKLWDNNKSVSLQACSAPTSVAGRPTVDDSATSQAGAAMSEEAPSLARDSRFQVPLPVLPPMLTPSLAGAIAPAEEASSSKNSSNGPILVPCRSRTAPPGHNIKTGYLLIPDDASHGIDLLCSHNQCRNEGVKFLYCAVCQLPVAKRNFRKRHSHLDILLNQVTTRSHPQNASKGGSSSASKTIAKPNASSLSRGKSEPSSISDSVPLCLPVNQELEQSSDDTEVKPNLDEHKNIEQAANTAESANFAEGANVAETAKDIDISKDVAANVNDEDGDAKRSSEGSGQPKSSQQTKGSNAPTHVSKTTPNGHSVSFTGSCSEPPSSLSNGDSNSNDSDLTTQATTAGMKLAPALKKSWNKEKNNRRASFVAPKTKTSKTMAEVLNTYNASHNRKAVTKKKAIRKLESVSNNQIRRGHKKRSQLGADPSAAAASSAGENESKGGKGQVVAPPFPSSKGNSSEEFKKSGAEELKNMRRLLRTNNDATAATASSSESSGAAVARQNQAAAEQAINVDEATTRMWETLLHERPSSNSVDDFRQWLLRCLSISARFEGNRQHHSDSINAKAANRDSSVHSCSARCSSVSSLSSETLQGKSSIASLSDVAVMIRNGVDVAGQEADGGPLKRRKEGSCPAKKRFQQEPHILELPDNFHINTPESSGTDGGSGSNSSNENKVKETSALVAISGGNFEPIGNVVPMIEDARRKKHKKRKRKICERDTPTGNRSRMNIEDMGHGVDV